MLLVIFHNSHSIALAGVAQWIELLPENQNVVGSIPNKGTCPGCGPVAP